MSTICKETAEELAANDGRVWEPGDDRTKPSPDNPQAYVVFKYRNDVFAIDCYAVVYSHNEYRRYTDEFKVLSVLWARGCDSEE